MSHSIERAGTRSHNQLLHVAQHAALTDSEPRRKTSMRGLSAPGLFGRVTVITIRHANYCMSRSIQH